MSPLFTFWWVFLSEDKRVELQQGLSGGQNVGSGTNTWSGSSVLDAYPLPCDALCSGESQIYNEWSLPQRGHSPVLKWDSLIELTAAWDTGVNGVDSAQGIKTGLSQEYEGRFLQKRAHWLAVEEYVGEDQMSKSERENCISKCTTV